MKHTLVWLWCLITNPTVKWEDPNTGVVDHEDKVTRFGPGLTWWTLRPLWTRHFLTTENECGCRDRFGIYRVIYCYNHAGINLDAK